MACIIPSGQVTELLDCWRSLNDQTYEIFGVECDLIYLGKVINTPLSPDENVPDLNIINPRRRDTPDEYDVDQGLLAREEVSEKITIKIYWNAKEWQTIYGYTTVPKNHVMFLAKLSDSTNLNRAIEIKFTDVNSKAYSFTRISQAVPYGFEKDRYCSSIWKFSE